MKKEVDLVNRNKVPHIVRKAQKNGSPDRGIGDWKSSRQTERRIAM
jgi:hypothetical protein